MPSWLHWNHNDFYHPLLLRAVPDGAYRALDVGCGTGHFARTLAKRIDHVDAVDRSVECIEIARAKSTNVTYAAGDFLTVPLEGSYDFISCIAALHHMPLEPALERFVQLLAPGGVLAVLGLVRFDRVADYVRYAAVAPLNAIVGAVYAVRRNTVGDGHVRSGAGRDDAPIRDPEMSIGEFRTAIGSLVPSATIRTHFFFRYLLVYTKR
jgi:SAM-dependent methyltransferase